MKKLALMAFIAVLLPAQAAFAADIATGKQKAQVCAACHGADGNSTSPQFPRLAGQYPDYLVKALQDYKSGARKNPIMLGFASGLSPADMENVAAYFGAQTGLQIYPPALK